MQLHRPGCLLCYHGVLHPPPLSLTGWPDSRLDIIIRFYLPDHHAVETLQDKAVAELEDFTSKSHPGDRNRFPRLLLLLSPLRSLHSETLEDLFFSGLIGNIQIDCMILCCSCVCLP